MKPSLEIPVSQNKHVSIEPNEELKEKIRLRAYQLYEQRGREDGHQLEDWVRAESEVIGTPIAA